MHQVGGDVNMHRREVGRKKDVADFMRRAEIRAGFGDDAGRAVGGMAATAIERLLKSIDKKTPMPPAGSRAQLLDIEEFSSGVPFALAVDLLESVSLGLRQPEAQPRAEIDANAELCIHRLSAREYFNKCTETGAVSRPAFTPGFRVSKKHASSPGSIRPAGICLR